MDGAIRIAGYKDRNPGDTIDLASSAQLCLKLISTSTTHKYTLYQSTTAEVFLTIAMQYISLPQAVPSQLCRPLIRSVFVAICWLITHNAFADSIPADKPGNQLNIKASPVTRERSLTDADCVDFINENPPRVRCGFIDLPVNHNEPDKGTVTLPVLIAGQTQTLLDTPSKKAILIPGGGGPGASIGFGEPYLEGEYLDYYSSLRAAGFDIVILDQRGAGLAKPALRCAETSSAFKEALDSSLSFTEALNVYHKSLTACWERLVTRKIPLADFDTYQSAQDFLSVIRLLPYDWWGTLATSYATVIAQIMESIEPRVFDRIVLDSPVAIDYQKPFTYELTEASIQRILSLCEITRRCDRRHRDIKTKFRQVLERVRKKPYSIPVVIPVDSVDSGSVTEKTELSIDESTLLDMLFQSAYSNYTLTEIPWAIDELYKNRPHKLKPMAEDYWYYNSDTEFATALSWTIHCKERQPLESNYLELNPGEIDSYSSLSKSAIEQERIICKEWKIPINNAPATNKLFTTKTFIVAGDLDPVISRDDIKNTADNFTDKEVMILPGMGHSVWFQSECTRKNTVNFFTSLADTPLSECKDGITRFK